MTLFLAIWGALLGSVTFAWNVWKWRQEKPQIIVSIVAIKSVWDAEKYVGIRLLLRNRGGKQTTVEEIFLCRRPTWKQYKMWTILCRLRKEVDWKFSVSVSNPETAKLPIMLGVNEMWEGYIPLEPDDPDDEQEREQIRRNRDIPNILNRGQLRFSIQCSHTHRRIRGAVKDEEDVLRE